MKVITRKLTFGSEDVKRTNSSVQAMKANSPVANNYTVEI